MHGRGGHLCQNRFYSYALDDVHCWRALGDVEQNPDQAKMVRVPWRYRWLGAAAQVSEEATNGLSALGERRKVGHRLP